MPFMRTRLTPLALSLLLVTVALLTGTLITPQNLIAQDAVIGPESYPDGVNPLTGLPVADPALLDRRPMLVKVSNFPPIVRPQSGLNQADIVWEHLLAGGVTRFSAFFLSQDVEKVGPIRSGRLVDFQLTTIYRSFFVYSGMAQGTLDYLNRDDAVRAVAIGGSGPCPALCRYPEEGVALEHTLYGDTAALRDLAAGMDRDTEPEPVIGMAFSEDTPPGGAALDGIDLHYRESVVGWEWAAERGQWLRVQDGEPHFDANTGDRVHAENVVIFEEFHTEQPRVRDGYWGPPNYAFSVNFAGSGRAILLRDGQYFEGVWVRDPVDLALRYYDRDGELLPFAPGRTFFNLVPRWVDGYSLTFDLRDEYLAEVTGSIGVNLRTGPGEAYATPDVAYPGDTYLLVGRNRTGDWLQVRRDHGAPAYWLPSDVLDPGDFDLETLPVSRPSVER